MFVPGDGRLKKNFDILNHFLLYCSPGTGIVFRVFSNEKISREMLDSHCCDVRKVRVSQLKRANVTGDSEWATMVVIASKSDCRRSANDNEYMFWQVTDLSVLFINVYLSS